MSKAEVVVVVKALTFEQVEMVSTRSSSTHFYFIFSIETDELNSPFIFGTFTPLTLSYFSKSRSDWFSFRRKIYTHVETDGHTFRGRIVRVYDVDLRSWYD